MAQRKRKKAKRKSARKKKTMRGACPACGWNGSGGCTADYATQKDRYPYATRHCTGWKNQPPEPSGFYRMPADYCYLIVRRPDGTVVAAYGPKGFPLGQVKMIADISGVGFDWGDESEGSLVLAGALLAELVPPAFVNEYVRDFHAKFIAPYNRFVAEWGLKAADVIEWFEDVSRHDWAETGSYTRCSKCGLAQRGDEKDGRCLRDALKPI